VVDPITNFLAVGDQVDTKAMLTRLIDFLKMREITGFFSSLTSAQSEIEDSEVGVSSLMDAWLLVRTIESNGERNRGLYILKARGIGHSNQVREFLLTDQGIELIDAYIGADGVLMGSARSGQLARERATERERQQTTARKQRELQRKQELYEAQLRALQNQYETERDAILMELEEEQKRLKEAADQRVEIARLRKADTSGTRIDENGARKARKGAAR